MKSEKEIYIDVGPMVGNDETLHISLDRAKEELRKYIIDAAYWQIKVEEYHEKADYLLNQILAAEEEQAK